MRYIINPYSQIISRNGKYEFCAPPQKNSTIKIEISIGDDLLDSLLTREGLTKDELINIVGVEKTNFLIEHGIYLTSYPDDNMVSSRSNQYFLQHLTSEQQNQIKNSNLLILGCGGIGSSIAWLLAGLGVNKITIVDFDVVETSNLNRMFMFDKRDIGKKKVLVIKEKLEELYENIEITAIDARITSEANLSEICSKDKFSLIVKALDSPSAFPIWLDSVCKKQKLRYVGGITLRDRVMVGPTYIPDVAEDGWSDIIHIDNCSEHIYGKVPSIGPMLFNATDRITEEAIKVLTENYDACKYKRCIFSENLFSGEQETIRKKRSRFQDDGIRKTTALLNLLVMIGFGCCTLYNKWFTVLILVLSCVLPFCSYYGKRYVLLQTFINSTIGSVFLSLQILNKIGFNAIAFCLVSIVVASIISTLNLCINTAIIELYGRE